MSCEISTARYLAHLGAACAAALGGDVATATAVLGEVFDVAQARAERRHIPTETDQTAAAKVARLATMADDVAAREATIAIFQAMLVMRPPLPLPAHTEADREVGFPLPKLPAMHAWRAIWETVQAVQSNQPLPNLTQEVRQAQIIRAGGDRPTYPDLLPNAPIPPGVASFAGHPAITGPGTTLARHFGGPVAAEDALGRIYAAARTATENLRWRSPSDTRLQRDRDDCAALAVRLTGLGLQPPPIPYGDQFQDISARASMAIVERVIASAERGGPLDDGGTGVLHVTPTARRITDLPLARQQQITEARQHEDPNVHAALLLTVAYVLQHGPDRDALLGEAFRASLRAKPSLRQRQDLNAIAQGLASAAVFDDAIGQMVQGRSQARVQEQLAVVLPYVDDDALDRWAGRVGQVKSAGAQQALAAALADERARRTRLRTSDRPPPEICPTCARYIGVRAGGLHNCAGPDMARLRARAIMVQAGALLHDAPDAAARDAVLRDASARLDQIARSAHESRLAQRLNVDDQSELRRLAAERARYQELTDPVRSPAAEDRRS